MKRLAHNTCIHQSLRSAIATKRVMDVPLSREDIELARRLGQHLGAIARGRAPMLRLVMARNAPPMELSRGLLKVLRVILEDLGSGRALRVAAKDAELTTQQAADYLKVSRPFLVKLLEQNKMPFRLVGTHRRIQLNDVVRYKHAIERGRRKLL